MVPGQAAGRPEQRDRAPWASSASNFRAAEPPLERGAVVELEGYPVADGEPGRAALQQQTACTSRREAQKSLLWSPQRFECDETDMARKLYFHEIPVRSEARRVGKGCGRTFK